MKQRKLALVLAFTISMEMMVSPIIVYAQSEGSKVTNTGANIANAIDMAAKVWSMVSSSMQPMSQQSTFDMAELQKQQTPSPDKYFNMQKLSQIPGLVDYLAINNINPQMLECKTLATTLFEAKPEVCRLGVTTDRGANPQGQLQEMYAYYNQYYQIDKLYRNFGANSNSGGQLFGVGCMNNAMEILNGFFKYRLNELDKLTTNLEALQAQFKEAARSDMDAIEEAVAVLEGGNSDITNRAKNKNPDLFDYGKRFTNPACSSMFDAEKFNQMGTSKGLNNINKTLKAVMTQKPPGSKFSGESYAKAHTSVVEDINNLADKVGKQFELGYNNISNDPGKYGSFLKDLSNLVSSSNGVNNALSPDLFSDAQTKFNEQVSKLADERATIMNELSAAGVNPGKANSLLGNLNSSSFESEVVALENQIQNSCLKNNLSGNSSIDAVLGRVYQPGISSHANKNAANFLKDKIQQILNNTQTSMDQKIKELQKLESEEGNRYVVKMDNTREVQVLDEAGEIKSIKRSAAVLQTPSLFFIDTIRNCQAQYKVNKLGSTLSGQGAIQKLRSLNQSYKSLAKTHSADLKQELKKKLIQCDSPEIANNTVTGSCEPSRFDTTSSSFCANAALSCSKNMQACSGQAQKFVTEIKAQKTARVNNYKALVEKNKKDIIKIFDTALSKYMMDGEKLRGVFGAGFSSPAGIQRAVMPESSRYLSELQQATSGSEDGALLLEDPDKYVDMFKQNIALLKKSVEDQQNQILGGSSVGNSNGLLAQHIKQTERNYREVQKQASSMAQDCISRYDEYVKANEQMRNQQQAEMQKKQTELGEKKMEVCALYTALAVHPNGECSENISNLINVDPAAVARYKQHCLRSGNQYSDEGRILSLNQLISYCKQKYPKAEDINATGDAGRCARLNNSSAYEGVYDKETKTTTSKYRLSEDKEFLTASIDLENQNEQSDNGEMPEAPAYCSAGDNSGREVNPNDPWSLMNHGLDTLKQATGQ